MVWLPWRRDRCGRRWHDLVVSDGTDAGEVAEDMRAELQRLAAVMHEPTAIYRDLRVPPWLIFTNDDE